MNKNRDPLVSICIPSYNRPVELLRLLNSIDLDFEDENFEVVIAEDYSPQREAIEKLVYNLPDSKRNKIRLVLNQSNLGYDANLRNLISNSIGEYIIFMGDDDVFNPNELNDYLDFLRSNCHLGYILCSHKVYDYKNTTVHKYFNETKEFNPSESTLIVLFRKSVLISGFTFKRTYFLNNDEGDLDGTLLFQLYILANIVILHPSAYYNKNLVTNIVGGVPYFGVSNSEKELYDSGEISVRNSLNFMKSYLKILNFIDFKLNILVKDEILVDISKYSYPILSIQRNKSFSIFVEYAMELKKMGFAKTIHFYIYFISLLIIGKNNSDTVLRWLRKKLGTIPQF
jgi:glycosyltransferase involved in cell wall biosynthesis